MPNDIPNSTWNETDASNTSPVPNGAPEGWFPSDVNNVYRMGMGATKRFWDHLNPTETTGGTTTAYTLTYSVAPQQLWDAEIYSFIVNATCGTAPTLNVNALGAKSLRKWTGSAWAALAAGDIVADQKVIVAYNAAGSGSYDIMLGVQQPFTGGTLTATTSMSGVPFNEAKGSDIASATTTDIGAATGNYVNVTGTTTITGLGTVQAGTRRTVTFTGALTLTHNPTSLIMIGGANILTAAGDSAEFVSLGSGNWKCLTYTRNAYVPGGGQIVTLLSGAVDSTSSAIPIDDTKPQNTEGKEFMSLAITPKSATSKLYVDVTVVGAVDTATAFFVPSLFQDSGADALATAIGISPYINGMQTVTFSYSMTSGTTSATTFKVRAGPSSGTFTFNGAGGSRYFGGAFASSITIHEVI